ncbi:MAG: hypothetical protein ABIZ09_16980 [Rhodoferax sp.]
MAISTINRFISLFDSAFHALPAPVSMVDVERLAMLVHHAMASKTRAYHNSSHVFYMCEGMKPVQVLAALFHDVVYYQLDVGFPDRCAYLLDGVTRQEGDALVLQPIPSDDEPLALCAALFDLAADQPLPLYGGMNEFLSAVVAARLLQPFLKTVDLIAVLACIEATIAFRAPHAHGPSATDRLAQRVQRQYRPRADETNTGAAQTYVDHVMTDAVALSNRDVGNFAEADPGLFLSTTWLLIEESNAPLKVAGVYTLQEYRYALTRMDSFLRSLNPAHVFQQYKGQPDLQTMDELCAAAARNITFSVDFLGAKITSIAIVEALALCTGTDGPISMFLGEIRSAYGRPERVEDYLPEIPVSCDVNPDLLRLFDIGRTLESANDLTASPITAFVYRSIGDKGTLMALAQARKMFNASLPPIAFLRSLNRDMVRAIVRACMHISLSRRDALLALDHSL